jgi:hypothetical protein
MINAEEILALPKLGKDDSFNFGCNQCGQCCKEREDILLPPLDLFKIAIHLNRTIKGVLSDYCESYEGATSKLPVVRIKPQGNRRICPFLRQGKCRVQPVKPAVCALFPIGRMTNFETGKFIYFLQPNPCGNKNQSQTVRQWLEEFSILEEENITILWHQKMGELSMILRDIYEKHVLNHDAINSKLFSILYLCYDLEQDFMPQFEKNCEEALKVVEKIASIGEAIKSA